MQVASFRSRQGALRLAARLRQTFEDVSVRPYEERERGLLYRVRVSLWQSLEEALAVKRRPEKMGYKEAFTVSL